MAIQYTWKITRLVKANTVGSLNNVVVGADWKCTATDTISNLSDDLSGMCNLTINLTSDTFVSFDSLTEQQVITWIWNSMSKVKGRVPGNAGNFTNSKEEIENALATSLSRKIITQNPSDITPLLPDNFPWHGNN